MKLIKPAYEIVPQGPGEEGIYKIIELVGRVCHKSEDKITKDSFKSFIKMLESKQHLSVFEHGTVYLKLEGANLNPNNVDIPYGNCLITRYINNPYSKVVLKHKSAFEADVYITTNYRVLVDNGHIDDLSLLCDPTEYHEKRVTVRFICSRGIWNEFIRHRTLQRLDDYGAYPVVDYDAEQNNSFAQESTRYCGYNKSKFNGCITYILPSWCTNVSIEDYERDSDIIYNTNRDLTDNEINFLYGLQDSEVRYLKLLEDGLTPQQARDILPIALKTELVMTGFVSDWEHFFKLRCAEAAHPDARALAIPLQKEFKGNGWIN